MAIYTAPTSIPHDTTDEALAQIQAWVDTVPDGTGPDDRNTLTFPFSGARYRINTGTLTFAGRKWLDFAPNDCLFEADLEGDGLVADSKTRSHFRCVLSQGLRFFDGKVRGPYTWAVGQQWIATWEAQHGFDVQGSRDIDIFDFPIEKVHGDAIYIGRQVGVFPHVVLSKGIRIFGTTPPTWTPTGFSHGSMYFDQIGRMGIAFLGCWDVEIHDISGDRVARATFDTECNDVNSTTRRVTVRDGVYGRRNGGFFWAAVGWPASIGEHYVQRNRVYGAPFSGYVQAGSTGRRDNYIIEDNWSDTPFGSSGAAGAWTFFRVDHPVVRNNRIPIDPTRNPKEYMVHAVDCCDVISEGNNQNLEPLGPEVANTGYAGELLSEFTFDACPVRPVQPPLLPLTRPAIRYGQH